MQLIAILYGTGDHELSSWFFYLLLITLPCEFWVHWAGSQLKMKNALGPNFGLQNWRKGPNCLCPPPCSTVPKEYKGSEANPENSHLSSIVWSMSGVRAGFSFQVFFMALDRLVSPYPLDWCLWIFGRCLWTCPPPIRFGQGGDGGEQTATY